MRQISRYLGLLFLALTVCSCQPSIIDDHNPGAPPPPGVTPTYRDLVESYNRNLAHLDRITAPAVVTFEWPEEGKLRHEQGDGRFIVILPDRLALMLGKVGVDGLWMGCNARQYWFFDLTGDKAAYVGSHANIGKPATKPLPAPIYPLDVPRLLGLLPIGISSAAGVEAKVTRSGAGKGTWMIEPPGTPGAHSRLYLDPVSGLPVRIELLDAHGQPAVVAKLSAPITVTTQGVPTGPRIASRIEVTVIKDQSKMVLYLSDASDGRDEGGIKEDKIFDFERLVQIYKPAKVEDLDRAGQLGAISKQH